MTFRCSTCGEVHEDLPDTAFRWPDNYFGVPVSERSSRVKADSDVCVIDDAEFCIRGVILMPIIGGSEHFGLGVWVSQKRENFLTYIEHYDDANIGPFFGWLSNAISFYQPSTWALPTRANFQGNGKRPLIEVAPCDHPLYRDVSGGVTIERAWEIVHHRVVGSDA